MESKRLKISTQISISTGLGILILYIAFTGISYYFYPIFFSPINNWLSDLGRYVVNTSGAIWYNIGCILTACLLIIFVASFRFVNLEKKWQRVFIVIGRISGVFAGISLIFSAIYSIDFLSVHSFWSMCIIFGLTYYFTFISAVLLSKRGFPRVIGIFGIIIAALDMVYGIAFNIPIMEWIAIFGSLVFNGIFAIFQYKQ